MPLLRRFSPEDYNATPSHWALATDKDGRLFVGNSEGVLRYDGETWSLIELPGKQLGRDVVAGADERIYVGSYDSFGWLRTSPDGETVYQELMTAAGLKGKARNVGDVWQIITTPEGMYFRGGNTLHFLSYDRKTVKHWPLPETQRSFYAQGNQLYARIDGLGFCKFVNGKFLLEPGGALFANKSLPGVLDRDGWRLLVGADGLYRADAQGIRPVFENAGAETARIATLRRAGPVRRQLRGRLAARRPVPLRPGLQAARTRHARQLRHHRARRRPRGRPVGRYRGRPAAHVLALALELHRRGAGSGRKRIRLRVVRRFALARRLARPGADDAERARPHRYPRAALDRAGGLRGQRHRARASGRRIATAPSCSTPARARRASCSRPNRKACSSCCTRSHNPTTSTHSPTCTCTYSRCARAAGSCPSRYRSTAPVPPA